MTITLVKYKAMSRMTGIIHEPMTFYHIRYILLMYMYFLLTLNMKGILK